MNLYIKLPCLNRNGETYVSYVSYINIFDITSISDEQFPREGSKIYYNASRIIMGNGCGFIIDMDLTTLMEVLKSESNKYYSEELKNTFSDGATPTPSHCQNTNWIK